MMESPFDITEPSRILRAVIKAGAVIDGIECDAERRDSFGRFAELEKVLIAALRDTEAALDAIKAERKRRDGDR